MIGLEKLRKRNDGICKKIIWVIIFLLVISTIVLVQNLRGKMKGELYGGADGYKIYYDQDLNTYAYQIFSLEGEKIDEVTNINGNLTVDEINDLVIHVIVSAGSYARQEWFYNRKTGEKSEEFFNVSAVNNTMTAYMEFTEEGKICLIIRDIFDKNTFYNEITRDFSKTATACSDLKEAVFLDEKTLKIEYFVGEDRDVVQEVLEL